MIPDMIVRFLLCIFLLFCMSANADTGRISDTLNDYMEGVAQGQPDRLKKAFHPDLKLYSVNEDGSLRIRSGQEYIAGITPGKKVNRIGRIVSIDQADNVATAKVEISIPGVSIFTDYFLLVKYQGAWKIIQKSYTSKPAPKHARKILVITSNQHTYGKTSLNTANHFEEIVVAYDLFTKQGYVVDFVSPDGGAIPLGYIQTSSQTQKDHLYNPQFMALLKNTLKPGQVDARDYQAVYYSGGGAAMFGVADNQDLQAIALQVYDNGGVVSAVCHGTAGIVNLKGRDGAAIFKNRKITGYPDLFEDTKAEYYKTFPFSIDTGRCAGVGIPRPCHLHTGGAG